MLQARILPHVACIRNISTRPLLQLQQQRPARTVIIRAADAPRSGGSSGNSNSSGGGPRKPRRQFQQQRRRRQRQQPPQELAQEELPWPVDLPDGAAELQAAMELMAALGPGEVALLARQMRDTAANAGLDAAEYPTTSSSGWQQQHQQDGEDEDNGGDGEPSFEWDADTLRAHMWLTLRAKLGPDDAAILDKAFGRDWANLGELDARTLEAAVAALTLAERARLEGVLDRLKGLMEMFDGDDDASELPLGADAGAWVTGGGGDSGRSSSSSSNGDAASSSAAAPYPGASPAMRAAFDAAQGRGGLFSDLEQQSSDAQAAGASTSSSTRQQRQEGNWDAAASSLNANVDSVLRHARAIEEGVQDWGPEPSYHFRVLKTIHARLSELDAMDLDDLEAQHGLTPADYEAAFEHVAERLAGLTDNADEIEDVATRSALVWMDAALADPSTGELVMDADKLAALGQFLAAAENLEKLKAWALAFAEAHPNLRLERLVVAAGLDGEDWFVARDARAAAARAVEAAAGAGAPLGPALLPHVDAERIEWLAALDGDALCFTADLQRRGYSADALIKWSLHPTVGPRLATGEWYDAANLPEVVVALAREAREPMPGVDFRFDFKTPSS